MPNVSNMYFEDYCDQKNGEFNFIGYTNLSGEPVVEDITGDLAQMVKEIQRKNGVDTRIRVYRPQ